MGNMKYIILASIVFTLSFWLNLVEGKKLPYRGNHPTRTKADLVEVENTEDSNRNDYNPALEDTDGADYLVSGISVLPRGKCGPRCRRKSGGYKCPKGRICKIMTVKKSGRSVKICEMTCERK